MINLKIQQLHLFTFIKNVTSNIYTCQLWLSYGREFFMGHINLFYVWLRGVIWHTFPKALVYAFNLHNLQKIRTLNLSKEWDFQHLPEFVFFCVEILKCAFFHYFDLSKNRRSCKFLYIMQWKDEIKLSMKVKPPFLNFNRSNCT